MTRFEEDIMRQFENIYKNKKVLVTGATGFKGSWLSLWLQMLGADVIGFSKGMVSEPCIFELLKLDKLIDSYLGDVQDYDYLKSIVLSAKPDIVFHLAAQPIVRKSYIAPVDTFGTNIMGTVNLLDICKDVPSIKSIVIISSDKCYKNKEWMYGYRENDQLGGCDPYSASKACLELVVESFRQSFYKENGVGLASVRAGNVIGGGDWAMERLVPDFIRSISKRESIHIRNPKAIRPWQHVLEPLSGYLYVGALMYKHELEGEAWNFGPNIESAITVEDLLSLCLEVFPEGKVEFDKVKQLHESKLLMINAEKAKLRLNWRPVYSVKQCIGLTMEWYKMYIDSNEDLYEYSMKQIIDFVKHAEEKGAGWCEEI